MRLTLSRFFNLVYHYLREGIQKEEDLVKLRRDLLEPNIMTSRGVPAWWKSDEDAAASGLAAARALGFKIPEFA